MMAALFIALRGLPAVGKPARDDYNGALFGCNG